MKFNKKRWAFVTADAAPQQPRVEELIFILAGTEGVSPIDPRVVNVDGNLGLLTMIMNPFYTVPVLPTTMKAVKALNPQTLAVEVFMVPDQPIIDPAWYASPYWNPYTIAVDPALTLIDEDTYWTMLSAYYVSILP